MKERIKEQLEMMNQQVKELAAIYHGAAGKYGISDNEFWVWYALLVLEGEYSQQDICDMWFLPKQTVNSIVANLARKGFVFLEAISGTRNRKVIRLSEEGIEYGKKAVMPIYQAEQRSFAGMSEQERQNCIALLGKYINFLKEEINEDETETTM